MSSFWSRTYLHRPRYTRFQLYFGDTAVSEMDSLVAEALDELHAIGVKVLAGQIIVGANRAGLHFAALSPQDVSVDFEARLLKAGWKESQA